MAAVKPAQPTEEEKAIVMNTCRAVLDAINNLQVPEGSVELILEGVSVATAKMLHHTFTMNDPDTRKQVYDVLVNSVSVHIDALLEANEKELKAGMH